MAEQVLIVDDDTRLSAMLADYLSANGYAVRTAATATASRVRASDTRDMRSL